MAVIGAGPAGLAAAYRLRAEGIEVDLYEAQGDVGGLCRSFDLWGHVVDLGPHRFFSSSEKVNRFWFQAVGDEFSWVPRQTRIFYKQKYFEYPLQAWNTFTNLGWRESMFSFASYLRIKLSLRTNDDHFENWVTRRFGRRLYEIFFKTYSEKLWGLPCDQIDPDFAYRKIRRLSVFEIVKRFFKKRDTFVDQFAYPHRGTGAVYQTIAQRFVKSGGVLKLNSPVLQVRDEGPKIEIHSQQERQLYDHVISTMPLNQLIQQLPQVPSHVQTAVKSLSFRNTILVYLWVEKENIFSDNWIYVHSPHVRFGRVTNFSNWSPVKKKEATGTVLCLEYWCSTEDELWTWSDEKLTQLAQTELLASQIASEYGVIKASHILKIPKSYPVFRLGYKKALHVVKEYLQKNHKNICTIGRYGSFKYNNQDHSLLMGLRAAEQFLQQNREDTESVNSDQNYEEDFELRDVQYDTFDEV